MSDLLVQNMAGIALQVSYIEHNPVRVAHFSGSCSGTWTPGDAVAFDPSGATGIVIEGSVALKSISFYLLDGTPALGDTATGTTETFIACDSLVADGDTLQNDGRTFFFVKNVSGSVVSACIEARGACSDGYLHPLTYLMGAGFQGPIGPFNRRRFNDSGGRVQVTYSGSIAPADFGVAAVRMFPSE